jgi:cell cycle sensor histidine kinase DivJ
MRSSVSPTALTNESLELDPRRRLEYAKINDSGHHLLSVVNGILDVSKMENGNFENHPEPFTPAPAIESCADCWRSRRRTRVSVHDAHRTRSSDVAPRRAFNQILINLISMPSNSTPRGGRVTVSARCDGRNSP